MCCVLGTLGRFENASSLPLAAKPEAVSFAFRLLVRDDFFSAAGLACVWLVTASPSATPLDPSAGLEGFEDDNLLW